MPQGSNVINLDKMEAFKLWMQTEFKTHCKREYGITNYIQYISPAVDDFLENIEDNISGLAEEALHDEELNYESFIRE